SGGTTTRSFAALAKRFLAAAVATISRSGVIHKPRPGNRLARSGTSVPSGPTTNRSNADLGRTARVARQRRSGPSGISGSGPPSASTIVAIGSASTVPDLYYCSAPEAGAGSAAGRPSGYQ